MSYIDKPKLYFKTKAAYKAAKNQNLIDPSSIVFIEDTNEIITHNNSFGSLSNDYVASTSENENLEPVSGDTYEEAIAKLHKITKEKPLLRIHDNKLQISYDANSWETISDYISAWFRWSDDNKIQISRDQKLWEDLSSKFENLLYIRGYVNNLDDLDQSEPLGAIYMVGPIDGFYHMYINTTNGWIDNGTYQALTIDVENEFGQNLDKTLSQKFLTDTLGGLSLKVCTEDDYNNLESKDDSTIYFCIES